MDSNSSHSVCSHRTFTLLGRIPPMAKHWLPSNPVRDRACLFCMVPTRTEQTASEASPHSLSLGTWFRNGNNFLPCLLSASLDQAHLFRKKEVRHRVAFSLDQLGLWAPSIRFVYSTFRFLTWFRHSSRLPIYPSIHLHHQSEKKIITVVGNIPALLSNKRHQSSTNCTSGVCSSCRMTRLSVSRALRRVRSISRGRGILCGNLGFPGA